MMEERRKGGWGRDGEGKGWVNGLVHAEIYVSVEVIVVIMLLSGAAWWDPGGLSSSQCGGYCLWQRDNGTTQRMGLLPHTVQTHGGEWEYKLILLDFISNSLFCLCVVLS